MEQKILSLKDDKIHSEVELFEYPEEIRGGRNYIKLFTNSDWKIHSRATIISERELVHVGNTGQGGGNRSTLIIELSDAGAYTISGYTKGIPDAAIVLRPIGGVGVQQTLYLNNSENYGFFKRTFVLIEPVKYQLEIGGRNLPTDGLYFKELKLEKGLTATPWTPAPEDLGLSYLDFITEFKPSISDRYILTEELIEYPEELSGGRNYAILSNFDFNRNVHSPISLDYLEIIDGNKYIISPDGHGGGVLHDFFKIEQNVQYIAHATFKNNLSGLINISFYDSDKVLIEESIEMVGTFMDPGYNIYYKGYRYWMSGDGKKQVLFKINDSRVAYARVKFGYFNVNIQTSPITVEHPKIEKGTIPTDWTPAPEDLGLTYPDHIQSFGTSFSNNILINEFIEQ